MTFSPCSVCHTSSHRPSLSVLLFLACLSFSHGPKLLGTCLKTVFSCPLHVVCIYLALMSSISPHPRSLSVLPWRSPHSLSTISLSFFLHRVFIEADALYEGTTPRARSFWGRVTSAAFFRACSISKVFGMQLGDWTWFSLHLFSVLIVPIGLQLPWPICCCWLRSYIVCFIFLLFPCIPFSSHCIRGPFLAHSWSFFSHHVSFMCLCPVVTWPWVLT